VKRFLWELYLFGVMGYMVTEYMSTGGKLEPKQIINSSGYVSDGVGYKIPPSFRLAGFSFCAWAFVGAFRIANKKDE